MDVHRFCAQIFLATIKALLKRTPTSRIFEVAVYAIPFFLSGAEFPFLGLISLFPLHFSHKSGFAVRWSAIRSRLRGRRYGRARPRTAVRTFFLCYAYMQGLPYRPSGGGSNLCREKKTGRTNIHPLPLLPPPSPPIKPLLAYRGRWGRTEFENF